MPALVWDSFLHSTGEWFQSVKLLLFCICGTNGIYVFGIPWNPQWIFCTDHCVWADGVAEDCYTVFAEVYVLTGILTALAFWQHRTNIKRLATGTENKFRPAKK